MTLKEDIIICAAMVLLSACQTTEQATTANMNSKAVLETKSEKATSAGLTGEEIKKLLVGNTLTYGFTRLGRPVTAWTYFKDQSTRVVTTDIATGPNMVSGWRVTPEGQLCWETRQRDWVCYTNLRLSGNLLRMDGIGRANNRELELIQGNPKQL